MHAETDMHGVDDMHLVGLTTGIVIRRTDGTLSTHTVSTATGETATIALTTPFADTATIEDLTTTRDVSASLVVSGDAGSEYRRCLVAGITADPNMRFSLTLVDEAPELVRG
jgi:hypothetical protein